MTHCPDCHAPLDTDYAFCPECGRALTNANEDAPTEAAVPSPTTTDAPPAGPETAFRAIRLARGGTGTTAYDIPDDGLLIGRESGDVTIPEDPTLSPRHLRLRVVQDTVIAQDAGSLNGHYLRITTPQSLVHDDLFVIGDSVFRLGADPAFLNDERLPLFHAPGEPPLRGTVTRILEDGSDGEVFPLRRFPFVFGREDGEARFPNDRFMSRRHAELRWENGRLLLVDLGSRNGTYIRREDDLRLRDGDILLIGRQLLRIEAVAP